MTPDLPPHASLDHLKFQARDLLESARKSAPDALRRLVEHVRGFRSDGAIRLSDAQLTIARENGFQSWAHLKRHLALPEVRRRWHERYLLLWSSLFSERPPSTVGELLDLQVEAVLEAQARGAALLHEWEARKQRAQESHPLTPEAARAVVAAEYGFEDWQQAATYGPRPLVLDFERALDALVCGDVARLRALLRSTPSLLTARSPFRHGATLLGYIAANGVESSRQWQSPGQHRRSRDCCWLQAPTPMPRSAPTIGTTRSSISSSLPPTRRKRVCSLRS